MLGLHWETVLDGCIVYLPEGKGPNEMISGDSFPSLICYFCDGLILIGRKLMSDYFYLRSALLLCLIAAVHVLCILNDLVQI